MMYLLSLLWTGFVYYLTIATIAEWLGFLMIAAIGKKLRLLLADHPLADERLEEHLKTFGHQSLNALLLRTLLSALLFLTL